jgi:hypothetical protein
MPTIRISNLHFSFTRLILKIFNFVFIFQC